MKRRTGALLAFVTLALPVVLSNFGLGSWVAENNKTQQYVKEPEANTQKVAYTQNSSGINTYFTTMESALEHTASGNIYVIPGTNPIIKADCVIKSGVILNLPYQDDLGSTHILEDAGRSTEGDFADKVEYDTKDNAGSARKVYCQSNVQISDNVKVTNNGSIFIGGVLGRNGLAPTGMTVGNYSKITLGTNSIIENKGKITCYGFIKESTQNNGSSIACSGTSELLQPVVVYDFRGGSYSARAVAKGSMPFNIFDFPNVQPMVSFSEQSKMKGTITAYASRKIVTSDPMIIGPANSSALIRYSSGTISYKYNLAKEYVCDDYAQSTIESKVNKTTFVVDGEISIASMAVDVGISIDTQNFHLPFSYKFNFEFQKGLVTVSNKVKFLAGSVVKIGSEASVTIKAETVFYQNYIPEITTGRGDGYPRYTKSAKFINNGTLNIKSSFGGLIGSSNNGATVKTLSGYSNKVQTTETKTGSSLGLVGTEENHSEYAKITLIDKKVFDENSDVNMLYEKSNGTVGKDDLVSGKELTSHRLNNIDDYGWYDGSEISNLTYGIRYELNSDTATYPNPTLSFNTQQSPFTIGIPMNSDEKMGFEGFYYDASLTEKMEGDPSGRPLFSPSEASKHLSGKNHVVIYAKWKELSEAHYLVTIKTSSASFDHMSEIAPLVPDKDLVVGESFSLEIFEDYYFYEGLSINGATASGTITRKTFNGYDLKIYDASGSVVKEISVDVTGSSIDGTFRSFSLVDTSIVKGNYRVEAIARFTDVSNDFVFTMNVESTTVNTKSSTPVSISTTNGDAFNGMNVAYNWTADNGKASLDNSALQSTNLRNGYKGSNSLSVQFQIHCTITVDSVQIAKLDMQITFKKGLFE